MVESLIRTSLVADILAHADGQPAAPCLRFHRDGRWQDLSWAVFAERVRRVAGGLERAGVRPGDRVAIVSENRPEWAVADCGALAAGAVVVTIYASLPGPELEYPLAHSGARVAFVDTAAQAEKVQRARERLPDLERVVVLEGEWTTPEVMSLAELEDVDAPPAVADLPGAAPMDRTAPATLIYTSGTTGVPKGVVLTHGNLAAVIDGVTAAVGDVDRLRLNLSFLPLAHAFERVAGHFIPLVLGHTIAYARGFDTLADDFRAVRPDFSSAVPRVFEKVHGRITARLAAGSPVQRALFAWALAAGNAALERRERQLPLSLALRARLLLADVLVFSRLRAALGGRLQLFVSGGAPLGAEIGRFFHAVGIPVYEGWGATETAAPATVNTPRAFRIGSVGRPLPGVEIRIAADGELEVRGPNVFAGYYRDPETTAEILNDDGWYRTGDIGRVDDDGYYYVTDRKKELLITAGGKNVAPQKLEGLLRASPLISNAMAIGDRRPFVAALLTLDRAALAERRPELADARVEDPGLTAALESEVAAVNLGLARYEQVRAFRVVEPDFSAAGGELTVTLKLKRRVVAERHAAAIEAMYAARPPAASGSSGEREQG